MKRDVVTAILIGFVLGGVGAVAATNLPNIFQEKTSSITPSLSPTPTATEVVDKTQLTIDQPKDQSISENKTVDLVARAYLSKFLLLESNEEAKLIEATTDGTFRTKINLTEGANEIYISAYDDKGDVSAKQLTIFYTSEKL